ncbi:hypothetical protein HER32_14285 [Hymenobacter sp. BT18]|uniref:hypothetical protein n=1 Tax=Hymenobacter sp. BT18 TaxID=2835648 RepID=UPI00143E267C|nr:hypothetical protein [Hymenobacter sp. BT18]QIX62282.1 hypothetical protein HER32_14285 [Hymenobacter sp. BT18]
MKHTLTITDDEGGQLTGYLPGCWDDVALADFTALATAPTAEARRAAMATLTGLPPAAFEEDPDLLANLLLNAPFLHKGPLPSGEPAPSFEYGGTTYHHVGDLSKLSVYQYQIAIDALPTDLPTLERMAAVVPHLLAMLYTPAPGPEQFDHLAQAPATMAAVPMSIGWPALVHLVNVIGPGAVAAQAYHEVHARALALVDTVEQQLLSAPPKGLAQKATHALTRRALQKARKVIGGTNTTPPKKKRNHGPR